MASQLSSQPIPTILLLPARASNYPPQKVEGEGFSAITIGETADK